MLVGAPLAALAADCGGPRPCACGDRVLADYALPADLGPCGRDGLRLGARVVFDGAGHSIIGSGAKGSVGLLVPSAGSGSFVQNVSVERFERGIRLNGASRVELTRVTAHRNGDFQAREGYGIDLASGASSNRIEHAKIFGNADEGIHFGSHARANRLVRSQIYDNGRENVYVLHGVDNVVDGCTLRGAGNAAAYIKHSKGTVLVDNRISGRPVVIRGASTGTRLVDNVLDDGGVVLQPYTDEKIGRARPQRTLVRGGTISGDRFCIRVDGADGTVVEEVALHCGTALELGGDSVVAVAAAELDPIRCAGSGEVRELKRVDVRFVDADGSPVAGVRLQPVDAQDESADVASADASGKFIGDLVESMRKCPKLTSVPIEKVRLAWEGGTATRPLSDISGRVVLPSDPDAESP